MFEIGDRVRIKSWEVLAEEFGYLDEKAEEKIIQCEFYFVEPNRKHCGKEFTITGTKEVPFTWITLGLTEEVTHYEGFEDSEFLISDGMIEHVE